VVLAACLLLRRWTPAAAAGVAALLLIAVVAPRMLGSNDTALSGTPVSVMSANVLKGQGDPEQLIAMARERGVEILTVQELTPKMAHDLDRLGIRKTFRYAVIDPKEGVSGGGVYSRFPATRLPNSYLEFTQARARVKLPYTEPLDVTSVHPVPPTSAAAIREWRAGLDSLPRPEGPGIHLLLGDFNATLDHSELRDLLETGYTDAGEQVGAGLIPTWPNVPRDPFRYMPVTIDHLLCEEPCGVRDYEVMDLEGSDHRPLHAVLVVGG
jgi:endonuclease/exonuclease/phosphatase (EEP) superfamily protein YafD